MSELIEDLTTCRWIYGGAVQGVGMRPYVYRLAGAYHVSGWVRNRRGTVEVVAQGKPSNVSALRDAIRFHAATPVNPVLLFEETLMSHPIGDFSIKNSESMSGEHASVLPDIGLCGACLSELNKNADKRFHYPLIQCAQCGPRYTTLRALPFERDNTAMANFTVCSSCRREYNNVIDRRFYAQNQCCPNCGPEFYLLQKGRRVGDIETILQIANEQLIAGAIIAVKGVGGYHLVCDATQESAVAQLRAIKHRPQKPFAVMIPECDDLAWLYKLARVDQSAITQLKNSGRPIVLFDALSNAPLAKNVAPCLNKIGVMLPYTGFYHLLTRRVDKPLVITSANVSGEPLIYDDERFEKGYGAQINTVFIHDRPIVRPVEDSVIQMMGDSAIPLRLSRGFAPLEIESNYRFEQPVIALGGHMKNAIAIGWQNRIALAPVVGDLGSLEALARMEQTISDFCALYDVNPAHFLVDAHPGYAQHAWCRKKNHQTISIFHHRGHCSALFAQNDIREDVLVFAWDGLGYGEDGTLWGGESFVGKPGYWQRIGSVLPFQLLGGERAIKQPQRVASSLLWQMDEESPFHRDDWFALWNSGSASSRCSSIGRLYDAAAALLGLVEETSYEAEAAMKLEAAAGLVNPTDPIDIPLIPGSVSLMDWRPLMRAMRDDGYSIQQRAAQFHLSLAESINSQAIVARKRFGVATIGLCGGVFQNRLLSELVLTRLRASGFKVLGFSPVPINDNGLAVGQLIEYAASHDNTNP